MPSSEAIWYYAQDDREHGPVTAAYIAGMARSGKLRPEDLVWREGMEDWRPARSVRGLFSPAERPVSATSDTAVLDSPFDALPPGSTSVERPAISAKSAGPATAEIARPGEVSPHPAPPPVAGAASRNSAAEFDAAAPSPGIDADEFPATDQDATQTRLTAESLQPVGRILLVAGLFLALLSRGCDFAAERSVARLEAKATLAQLSATEAQVENVGAVETATTNPPQTSPSDEARHQTLAAQQARLANQAWEFWRGVCFLLGAVLFTVGLLPLALAGAGTDRWLGIVLLAVLTFAVFSQRAP